MKPSELEALDEGSGIVDALEDIFCLG